MLGNNRYAVERLIPRKMDRWAGKVAIVTGASGGIGESIAVALVEAGLKVVGLARRLDKMQALTKQLQHAKGCLHAIKCDLRKEDDILKAFEWTEKNLGGADVLVNNAGLGYMETIIDGTTEHYRNIMEVNVIAVAICTREAVRSMRARNVHGHIININSIVGHNADIKFPASVYPASKFAVTAMTTTVRNELRTAKVNVKITSISPGAVTTDFAENAKFPMEEFKHFPFLAANDVTGAVIYALGTPPNVQVNELIITPLWESW